MYILGENSTSQIIIIIIIIVIIIIINAFSIVSLSTLLSHLNICTSQGKGGGEFLMFKPFFKK
jgi:hypothetical protein